MKRELQKLSAIALSLEKEGNIVAGRIITEAMQKIASWQDITDDTLAGEGASLTKSYEGDPSIPHGTHALSYRNYSPQWTDVTDLVKEGRDKWAQGGITPEEDEYPDHRELIEEALYENSGGNVVLKDLKEENGRIFAQFEASDDAELEEPEPDWDMMPGGHDWDM